MGWGGARAGRLHDAMRSEGGGGNNEHTFPDRSLIVPGRAANWPQD